MADRVNNFKATKPEETTITDRSWRLIPKEDKAVLLDVFMKDTLLSSTIGELIGACEAADDTPGAKKAATILKRIGKDILEHVKTAHEGRAASQRAAAEARRATKLQPGKAPAKSKAKGEGGKSKRQRKPKAEVAS